MGEGQGGEMDFLFVWLVEQFSVWWSLQSTQYMGHPPDIHAVLKWHSGGISFGSENVSVWKTRFYLITKPQNFLSTYRSLVLFTKKYRTKHVLPLLSPLFFNLSSKKANHHAFYELYPWFLWNIFSPRNVHGFCQDHLAFNQSRDSLVVKVEKKRESETIENWRTFSHHHHLKPGNDSAYRVCPAIVPMYVNGTCV